MGATTQGSEKADVAIDPVCGMRVQLPAKQTLEIEGERYAFCCAGCKSRFFRERMGPDADEAIDPICGMRVRLPAKFEGERDGQPANFCSAGCKEKFETKKAKARAAASPPPEGKKKEGYICPMCPEVHSAGPDACPECGMALERARPPRRRAVVWTCPMHPEIEQDAPGECPECGMALEPKTRVGAPAENPELADMRRRFWMALAFAIPLLGIGMGDMVLGHPFRHAIGASNAGWLQALLAAPIVLYAGAPFFVRAWRSLWPPRPNMFTLIGLGVVVAFGYSLVAQLAPGVFPPEMVADDGAVGVYFEATGAIVTLVLLGQVLELRAREGTGRAIEALLALVPPVARRIEADGSERDVPVEAVIVGDLLRVRPGETIPVDGVIAEGEPLVDESSMTGEPLLVRKAKDQEVLGGTVNGERVFSMRATRVGEETLLSRIVDRVADAQRSRAPIQSAVDRVSAIFVPAVVVVAVGAFAIWMLFGPEPRLSRAIVSALAVLIIACPCALGLATPMSIMVAMGRSARAGVLFRDADAIERLRDVDTLVVDKTGTITEGRPRVVEVRASRGADESHALAMAAAVERGSEHPLGRAIVQEAEARELPMVAASAIEAVVGKGVVGEVSGVRVAIGSQKWMQELGVALGDGAADAAEGEGQLHVALDDALALRIVVQDPVKASSSEAIRSLRDHGLDVVMLTGDSERAAREVAKKVCIEKVEASLLPTDKADHVRRLQKAGRVVAMAGDGINDAPALAAADVGIAMGTGSDLAIESAHVTLVKGDLRAIARARVMSEKTMANIRAGLWLAFGYNGLAIPIAAGALYPIFGIVLSPIVGAAAMSLSSLSVIGNALRLSGARLR